MTYQEWIDPDIEILDWTARKILPLYQRDWLTEAMEILREDFEQIGEPFPKEIFIKVEYPNSDIGHTWLGKYQRFAFFGNLDTRLIYINPSIDGLMALDVLVHELVHVVVGQPGHGERFMEIASAIGMNDNGPSAGAEEVLLKRLRDIQETLGSYPLVFDCLEEA